MNQVINADNLDLQASKGGMVIGSVDLVNGATAVEVPDFVPTKGELLELVKFWESTFLHRALFIFDIGQIGSTDLKTCPFAEGRVDRIIALLGQDATDAVAEVREQFARETGERAWQRFRKYLGPAHMHDSADVPDRRRPNAAH